MCESSIDSLVDFHHSEYSASLEFKVLYKVLYVQTNETYILKLKLKKKVLCSVPNSNRNSFFLVTMTVFS